MHIADMLFRRFRQDCQLMIYNFRKLICFAVTANHTLQACCRRGAPAAGEQPSVSVPAAGWLLKKWHRRNWCTTFEWPHLNLWQTIRQKSSVVPAPLCRFPQVTKGLGLKNRVPVDFCLISQFWITRNIIAHDVNSEIWCFLPKMSNIQVFAV